ncbi:hypothetical protein WMF31_06350 [Sorangium sp. So ce1036]|uniref:hypothetical protein n=1 Tax=Sorangium sp. So ce1036 TaxID=3133328 RepID=UPI003EFC7528
MGSVLRFVVLDRAAVRVVVVAIAIAAVLAYSFLWRTVRVRNHAADKKIVVWLEMDGAMSRRLALDSGARSSTFVWGWSSRDALINVFVLQGDKSVRIGSCGYQGRWSRAVDYVVLVVERENGELRAWCERVSALDTVMSIR